MVVGCQHSLEWNWNGDLGGGHWLIIDFQYFENNILKVRRFNALTDTLEYSLYTRLYREHDTLALILFIGAIQSYTCLKLFEWAYKKDYNTECTIHLVQLGA